MPATQTKVKRVLLVFFLSASFVVSSVAWAADEQASPTPGKEVTPVEVAPHRTLRVGAISLGAFYSYSSGCPFLYGCYPYFWDPYYSGFWPTYWYYPPFYPPVQLPGYSGPGQGGEIRLETNAKTAEVYLNGALAGIAGHLKSFWLAPGVYELEIRTENRVVFQQRIYVLTGKTIRVKATLAEEKKEALP
ncbi:MAG: PEGA domain-containing protein [Acidobacteriia bacterium]|nr:PEGA domain-containing protein [Terriglobia bacterium]